MDASVYAAPNLSSRAAIVVQAFGLSVFGALCPIVHFLTLRNGHAMDYQYFVAVWCFVVAAFSISIIVSILRRVEAWSFTRLATMGTALYVGSLVGFAICGTGEQLWTVDSHAQHLPGIQNVMAILRGQAHKAIQFDSAFGGPSTGKLQFTYVWIAPWFMLFGASPVVSGFALLLLRQLTWLVIYKTGEKHFGRRQALIATTLTIFIPTQIFYALAPYKDPAVQLLVTAGAAACLEIYKTGSWRPLALAVGILIALALERIYVVPMLGAGVLLAAWISRDHVHRPIRRPMVAAIAMAFCGVFVWWCARDMDFFKLGKALQVMRWHFMNYPDVTSVNDGLPYPIYLVKIAFTPFFTPAKLTMFTDFSALITWGSFMSQAVIALAFWGVWIEARRERYQTLIMILPFTFFVFLFAYLAPFSGRQRDSFLPTLTLLSAVAIVWLFERRAAAQSRSLFQPS